jgi:hypothetical protein
VPTFGFSAFLKLVSLNTRPQRTLMRRRLSSAGQSGGYDFHRSLKLRANRFLVERVALPEILLSVEDIKRIPERNSARKGLEQLGAWRDQNDGEILAFEPVLFESPAKNFKVQFSPNFGIRHEGRPVATHIWNTAKPDLDVRMVYAALSLFPSLYADHDQRPDDLAVLSLRNGQFLRLGEVEDHTEVGLRLIRRLDELFEEVRREGEKPRVPTVDQPTTRQPPH